MTITIDTTKFTDEERERFMLGWELAGGYMGDCVSENPCPWCMPWESGETIKVIGETPEVWGADYWHQVKDEVERILAEEREAAEQE